MGVSAPSLHRESTDSLICMGVSVPSLHRKCTGWKDGGEEMRGEESAGMEG